jgi:hypothetical protein
MSTSTSQPTANLEPSPVAAHDLQGCGPHKCRSGASSLCERGGLLPGCSGDHAVDNNVDGEAKPLVAIARDHLRGVSGNQRKPVGR